MELNELLNIKIKECRIYGLTSPKIIKEILNIPVDTNLKKLDKQIDTYYDTFYIKKTWAERKPTKQEKHSKYLNIEKNTSIRLLEIPENEEKTSYRKIVTINCNWLKKTQKRLNRILMGILLDKKVRGIKQKSVVPYLHSSVKQKSYITNAQVHLGDRYVFAIDLKDFYPSVTKKKIYNFFKEKFHLPPDIAMIYAVLSTCKADDGIYRLGQGLSQSATLAYLVNYEMFNYLYVQASLLEIDMSIYVDDVVFSSRKRIPQEFINTLFGIVKSNGMLIKREKVHYYRKESVKKITGVYVDENKTRVANKKHEEFHVQYKYLKNKIMCVNNFDEYFQVYNLYLKFFGNYQHIKSVEGRVHDRYEQFIKDYDQYFPKGINKKQKNMNYQKGNIKNEKDSKKINSCYQKLKNRCQVNK